MDKLFVFNGSNVRIVERDGEPWFVLKDVCEILEIGNPSDVKSRLTDGVVSIEGIPDSLGRTQQATVINEDGLYDVILDSRKPEAKAFRKWITSEVIPSIRRKGMYVIQDSYAIEDPVERASRWIEEKKALLQAQALLEATVEIVNQQAPKVAFFDLAMTADNSQPVGTVAKALGMGRNTMFKFLRERKVLMPNSTLPYQRYIDSGYFVVREHPQRMGDRVENVSLTRITAKGMEYIAKMMKEA